MELNDSNASQSEMGGTENKKSVVSPLTLSLSQQTDVEAVAAAKLLADKKKDKVADEVAGNKKLSFMGLPSGYRNSSSLRYTKIGYGSTIWTMRETYVINDEEITLVAPLAVYPEDEQEIINIPDYFVLYMLYEESHYLRILDEAAFVNVLDYISDNNLKPKDDLLPKVAVDIIEAALFSILPIDCRRKANGIPSFEDIIFRMELPADGARSSKSTLSADEIALDDSDVVEEVKKPKRAQSKQTAAAKKKKKEIKKPLALPPAQPVRASQRVIPRRAEVISNDFDQPMMDNDDSYQPTPILPAKPVVQYRRQTVIEPKCTVQVPKMGFDFQQDSQDDSVMQMLASHVCRKPELKRKIEEVDNEDERSDDRFKFYQMLIHQWNNDQVYAILYKLILHLL